MRESAETNLADFDLWLAPAQNDPAALVESTPPEEEQVALLDLLDKLLTKGVVVSGDLTISVAGVDLLYVGLRLLLTTVEKASTVGAIKLKEGRTI